MDRLKTMVEALVEANIQHKISLGDDQSDTTINLLPQAHDGEYHIQICPYMPNPYLLANWTGTALGFLGDMDGYSDPKELIKVYKTYKP